jgi:hypothetical protein
LTGVGFSAATNYSTGSGPSAVAVADFNGDGKNDLAVANYGSNNISVLLGNGNGSFLPQLMSLRVMAFFRCDRRLQCRR